MIGQHVTQFPEIAKRVADAGFPIYSHTFTHADLRTLTKVQIEDEIIKTRDAIASATGKEKDKDL
jgi:peptidoglycan/xylan/chitin deacetylase (PgdA/CDA1 family)